MGGKFSGGRSALVGGGVDVGEVEAGLELGGLGVEGEGVVVHDGAGNHVAVGFDDDHGRKSFLVRRRQA